MAKWSQYRKHMMRLARAKFEPEEFPEKPQESLKFAPKISISDAGTHHNQTRLQPVSRMQSRIKPYQQHGRTKSAKRASITRTPEMSKIAEQIQGDLYPPVRKFENLENLPDSPKLAGLSSMTPAKRKIHDIAMALSDDYLDPAEQLDMAEIRYEKPVSSVWTDSYSPAKTRIPYEEQEGF